MRDIVLASFIFGAVPFILWRPTIGVFFWVWVSVMNPHRLTHGFAYDLPFAQVIAIATLVGMLFSRAPKRLPLTPVTVVLAMMVVWMIVTTAFGLDPAGSVDLLGRHLKILFMVFISMYLLHSKLHVQALICVLAASVAFYGIKGGVFTVLSGGATRVWGPAGSYIEENNALAVATIMTIPLLYYLFLQAKTRWMRWGLLASMLLCGLSALGSHSRGALLAIGTMFVFLWLKSSRKLVALIVLAIAIPAAIGFMPDRWDERMRTIEHYDQDSSSMGRINAWGMAWNLALDRPLGGGSEIYNESIFRRYAPYPIEEVSHQGAHSIYFQMLGEQGFLGLGLFLLLWFLVWRDASWITKQARNRDEFRWAANLASMIQVSLIGYAVGGAFLYLAYYDVPYNLLVAIVVTRELVDKEIKRAAQDKKAPLKRRHQAEAVSQS